MAAPESEYRDHRLAGVIAKFNRSKQQFDVLGEEIGGFSDQDPQPHFSRGYFDVETWEWIERFQVREPPPLRWGVMLGDSVHNLRSALDHLIYQLTLLDGGTMEDCAVSQFPIVVESRSGFTKSRVAASGVCPRNIGQWSSGRSHTALGITRGGILLPSLPSFPTRTSTDC